MSIEDELNMTREKLIDGDLDVDIPDDIDEKNLELIVTLALKSYQEQMSTISFLEIKHRMKAYEVAERYLGQAKDARYKLDYLRLQRERSLKNKPGAVKNDAQGDGSNNATPSEGKSRKELMEQFKENNKQ